MVWFCTEFRKDDFRWEIFLVAIRVVFLLRGIVRIFVRLNSWKWLILLYWS